MRPLLDPLPADGALIQEQANTPASALDESLLGDVLARRPRGISQASSSISSTSRGQVSPRSPSEIVRWFEEFLLAFGSAVAGAPPQNA